MLLKLRNGGLIRYLPAVRRGNIHVHSNYNAHQLFDEIPQRNISSLNSHLSSHLRNNDAPATWELFLDMHRMRTDLNSYTFTPVLGACSALSDPIRGMQVHALMIKNGSDSETVTQTKLMDMYSKHGKFDDTVRVFDEMGFKDVVTWNSMISSYLRHNLFAKAVCVFEQMQKEGVVFSEFTLCSVLKACTALNAYKQGKQVHAMVIVMGRDLVVLGTALIDMYSTVGCMNEAMEIYRNLSWQNDEIMQNSLISGCSRNKNYREAFSIIRKMKPNKVALTSALAACSENSYLWIAKQVHAVAVRQFFTSDTQLNNALLNMYAKNGVISKTLKVFKKMPQRDIFSWTSMIDAYGSHGYGLEAVELFKKMVDDKNASKVSPNSVTLLSVLSACGHSGLVEEGKSCFISAKDYGIKLGPEHYACFMDMLGRTGKIEEVWSLLDDMEKNGVEPTSDVWAELLNACKINNDMKRGEIAAKRLFELDSENPSHLVAVSNFYADIGRWDHVDSLRSIMKGKRLSKGSGSSWVTSV